MDWLQYFGITPEQITPLVLFALVAWWWYFRDLKQEVVDIYHASREMQLHLEKDGGATRLTPMHRLNKLTWAAGNSPLELNALGKGLAHDSGIEKMVQDNDVELIGLVEDKNPPTALDVEQCSSKILSEFVLGNKLLEKEIKDFVFNHPVYKEKEISLNDIFFVGGLLLRDAYFERHPELKRSSMTSNVG